MILPYCKSLDEGLKISFLIPNKCKFCGRKSSKHCTSHPHTHSTNSYWAPTCGKCLGAILRCSEQDNISPSLRELIETTEGILRMDIDHFILFLSFGRSPEGYRPQKKLCQKKKKCIYLAVSGLSGSMQDLHTSFGIFHCSAQVSV